MNVTLSLDAYDFHGGCWKTVMHRRSGVVIALAALLVAIISWAYFSDGFHVNQARLAPPRDGSTTKTQSEKKEPPQHLTRVNEVSKHPTDMPDHTNYTLYRNGRFDQSVERTGPVHHEVHLDIGEVVAEVISGTTLELWTFNDTVPGPMIRARVGDTIDFYLHNPKNSRMPHNIDFHAVTGPGGGSIALDTVPGATSRLQVKLLAPGIFTYHCAFPDTPTHVAHGMYGLLVVEPEEGLPPVDHEFYIMQGEYFTDQGGKESVPSLENKGHLSYSGEHGNLEEPTFVVFNGRPESFTGNRALGVYGKRPIQVGDTARLFVGNAGPGLISSFHVIGEIFDRVYVEGSFSLFNQNVQTTLIPAGGAVGVELTFEVPGTYIAVDHSLFRLHKGASGVMKVDGASNPAVYEPIDNQNEIRK